MSVTKNGTYSRDLALVYYRGFGYHANASLPGILTPEGVSVTVSQAVWTEHLPPGLRVLMGQRFV